MHSAASSLGIRACWWSACASIPQRTLSDDQCLLLGGGLWFEVDHNKEKGPEWGCLQGNSQDSLASHSTSSFTEAAAVASPLLSPAAA